MRLRQPRRPLIYWNDLHALAPRQRPAREQIWPNFSLTLVGVCEEQQEQESGRMFKSPDQYNTVPKECILREPHTTSAVLDEAARYQNELSHLLTRAQNDGFAFVSSCWK